jgi:glycosyltransferase involved in cell wall biosynthesis
MAVAAEPGIGAVPEQADFSVSVVIPCFNQAHYLSEAIESVASQTRAASEIIVVDDGSSDNSYAVAGRYASVRQVRQANRGVAAARNAGLASSSGDFLVFLDADDRLLSRAIEIGGFALARRPHIAFVSGLSRDIGNDGQAFGNSRQPLVMQDHYLRLLEDCYIWSGSSVVYRRSAVEEVGGFDESLTAADDYDLYLRLARRNPVYSHDDFVTEYRRHGSNTTRDSAVVLTSQLDVLKRQRSQLKGRRERDACRAGMRQTRAEHGRALAEQVEADWRGGRRRRAMHGLRTLVRRDPGHFAQLVVRTAG